MRNAIVQVVAPLLLIFGGTALCADLSDYEKTCAELGFRPRTPAYGECVLELDRRAKVGQQSNRSRIDQEQQRAEQQRQEQDRQRNEESAMRGDGTPDHQTCYRYGYRLGTTPYSDCRLKLDLARREAEQKQAAYELEQQRYKEQLAAYEREKERQRGLFFLGMGARIASGQSVVNAAAGAAGIAPVQPQRPSIENYIITMPGGRTTHCNYVVSARYMNCQ